ncbi:MAG: fructosamine kinase family protein [Cryomorphaceae bacterium]
MNSLDTEIHSDWEKSLSKFCGRDVELQRVEIVGGGSINDARRLYTSEGIFFAKINTASEFPGMLEAEADGLSFLAKHSSFKIPGVAGTGVTNDQQWILMEHISSSSRKKGYWETFGCQMAEMHRSTNEEFGYDKTNYLGSLVQKNNYKKTWAEFFVEVRLAPLLEMARQKGEASQEMVRLFEKLFSRAEKYFPEEPPAAVHGDLWTGNFMTDEDGNATIFDPASYFGHREMDLGMSQLFGGFDPIFYSAYNEAYPLEKDWQERLDIANLYPLLAHLTLFGGSYAFKIISILRKKV